MKKILAALAAVVAMFVVSAQPAAAYGPTIGNFWRQTDCAVKNTITGQIVGNLHVTNYQKGPAGQTYHWAFSAYSGYKRQYVAFDGAGQGSQAEGYVSYNDRKYHGILAVVYGATSPTTQFSCSKSF